jgi:hypothetical protein
MNWSNSITGLLTSLQQAAVRRDPGHCLLALYSHHDLSPSWNTWVCQNVTTQTHLEAVMLLRRLTHGSAGVVRAAPFGVVRLVKVLSASLMRAARHGFTSAIVCR